jgi:hypothetical protein
MGTRLRPGDLVAVAVAAPLIVSVVRASWLYVWERHFEGPLGNRAHALLLSSQFGAVLWLASAEHRRLALAFTAALYASLAVGVAVIRVTAGPVPCGCWGASSSTTSVPLAVFDTGLALCAGVAAGSVSAQGSTVPSVALFVTAALVLATAFLLVPIARPVLNVMRSRAAQYADWVRGWPQLDSR